MGKDRLAARQDLWTTRREERPRRFAPRPDHPRPAPRLTRRPVMRAAPRVWSFRAFRLVAPVVVPLMLGVACFALLVLLSISAQAIPLAIGVEGLAPIFFVYAAAGVVMATALAYAPNDTVWSVAMFAGLITYGTITLWAIFGALVALALLVGLGALLGVVVRVQLHTVLEDTAHAMVLFGKHNRVLRPGFNLRWPFEQVWAIINTAEVAIDVSADEITLPGGTQMRAAATAACRAAPERAHLTAPHANEWVEHARRCLDLTLRETLSEMEPEEIFPTDGAPATDALNVRLRGRMQQLVGSWGISVGWVRVHALAPAGLENAYYAETLGVSTPDVASGPHAAIPRLGKVAANASRLPDVATVRGVTPGALLPASSVMRPGVPLPLALSEAYAAVRERRITDLITIARIARAFEAVASDSVLAPHLPFDADEAARNLRQLADKMTSHA